MLASRSSPTDAEPLGSCHFSGSLYTACKAGRRPNQPECSRDLLALFNWAGGWRPVLANLLISPGCFRRLSKTSDLCTLTINRTFAVTFKGRGTVSLFAYRPEVIRAVLPKGRQSSRILAHCPVRLLWSLVQAHGLRPPLPALVRGCPRHEPQQLSMSRWLLPHPLNCLYLILPPSCICNQHGLCNRTSFNSTTEDSNWFGPCSCCAGAQQLQQSIREGAVQHVHESSS